MTTTTKNALTTFNFQKNNVRVVEINGEPWFSTSDVCQSLGLSRHPRGYYSRHIGNLDAKERGQYRLPTGQDSGRVVRVQSIISESGLTSSSCDPTNL